MLFRPEFRHLAEIERTRIVMPPHHLRLNRLEKPAPWPADFQALIAKALSPDTIQQYPDYPPFYERLAVHAEVESEEIVIGAGIEEFLRTLFMLCAAPGEKVAILWPTCAMFEIYARAFGVELVRIAPDPASHPTAEDLIAQLPDDLRLFILPNPSQPVETHYSQADLMDIARACADRGAVLAIDEAYHGFGGQTFVPWHRWCENVVVLRTFSKAAGAASIRLGYAIAAPRIKRTLDAVRQSGEVSAASMAAATVIMDKWQEFVRPSIDDICAARDTLRMRCQELLGLRAYGRRANHVLIQHPDASAVAERLADRGVLVKAGFPAPVDNHLLVTCGGRQIMGEFYEVLRGCV